MELELGVQILMIVTIILFVNKKIVTLSLVGNHFKKTDGLESKLHFEVLTSLSTKSKKSPPRRRKKYGLIHVIMQNMLSWNFGKY